MHVAAPARMGTRVQFARGAMFGTRCDARTRLLCRGFRRVCRDHPKHVIARPCVACIAHTVEVVRREEEHRAGAGPLRLAIDHHLDRALLESGEISFSRRTIRGTPLALLTEDGKLYQITGGLAADMNAKLIPHIAHTVEITGDVTDKDGKKTSIQLTPETKYQHGTMAAEASHVAVGQRVVVVYVMNEKDKTIVAKQVLIGVPDKAAPVQPHGHH